MSQNSHQKTHVTRISVISGQWQNKQSSIINTCTRNNRKIEWPTRTFFASLLAPQSKSRLTNSVSACSAAQISAVCPFCIHKISANVHMDINRNARSHVRPLGIRDNSSTNIVHNHRQLIHRIASVHVSDQMRMDTPVNTDKHIFTNNRGKYAQRLGRPCRPRIPKANARSSGGAQRRHK